MVMMSLSIYRFCMRQFHILQTGMRRLDHFGNKMPMNAGQQ